jgi:hypothetical protein
MTLIAERLNTRPLKKKDRLELRLFHIIEGEAEVMWGISALSAVVVPAILI